MKENLSLLWWGGPVLWNSWGKQLQIMLGGENELKLPTSFHSGKLPASPSTCYAWSYWPEERHQNCFFEGSEGCVVGKPERVLKLFPQLNWEKEPTNIKLGLFTTSLNHQSPWGKKPLCIPVYKWGNSPERASHSPTVAQPHHGLTQIYLISRFGLFPTHLCLGSCKRNPSNILVGLKLPVNWVEYQEYRGTHSTTFIRYLLGFSRQVGRLRMSLPVWTL